MVQARKEVKETEIKQAVEVKKVEIAVPEPKEVPKAPAPPPQIKVAVTGKEEIKQRIRLGCNWDSHVAIAIGTAESGLRNEAVGHNTNGTTDTGIFQINSIHAAKVGGNVERFHETDTNINVACQLYHSSGWYPWTVFKTGAYRQYL